MDTKTDRALNNFENDMFTFTHIFYANQSLMGYLHTSALCFHMDDLKYILNYRQFL